MNKKTLGTAGASLGELMITRMKEVKQGPTARPFEVATTRSKKKYRVSSLVLTTTKKELLDSGESEISDEIFYSIACALVWHERFGSECHLVATHACINVI